MFALPPPPTGKYSAANLPATLETHNVLKHPVGPDFTLQVGEGTYVLRDDLQLSTPPHHPAEAPPTNPNPLATATIPPTAGVRVSTVIISPKKSSPQLEKSPNLRNGMFKWTKLGLNITEKEVRHSQDSNSDASSPDNALPGTDPSSTAPAFGEGNTALTPALGKDSAKRRKPKTNMIKSNSSFVSRVISHDQLTKRLSERDQSGLFAFANINRAFQWLDLSSATAKQEPLAKVLFTKAHMLCHDVNMLTKSTSHLDIVMGSSAGDILWYEPFSIKYNRLNKNGLINDSPVSSVKWIPGSDHLFLAAHMDGSLLVYDKEREDAPMVAEESVSEQINGQEDSMDPSLLINKSVKSPNQKSNPVACWRISNHRINEIAFAPDSRHLAVVTEDGCLHVIDYLQETLLDVYTSYYGGVICVCWSPDGKYVLTGGQDDLVSIWSLSERQIVARCPGHDSWVTSVAFDPWRCDERNYRFGSVGEDCKLLLWDFSVGMLHRPKGTSGRARGSISNQSFSLQRHRTESASAIQRIRSDSNRSGSIQQDPSIDAGFMNHSVEPYSRTAQLPPVFTKRVDDHPLTWLGFFEDAIMTSCVEGHIRTWDRPKSDGVNGGPVRPPAEKTE